VCVCVSLRSYLEGHVGLPVEHEGVGGELGGGVYGHAEEEGDGVQEVVPLSLLVPNHLGDGVVQQAARRVVQRVELLRQRAHLLGEVPPVSKQLRHLVDTQGTAMRTK